MHHHRRALVKHQEIQYEMKMKMDYHKEKPGMTNHVGIYGKWAEFERVCRIEPNKMVRIHYMYTAQVFNSDDDEEEISVFHVKKNNKENNDDCDSNDEIGGNGREEYHGNHGGNDGGKDGGFKGDTDKEEEGNEVMELVNEFPMIQESLNCKVNVSESNYGYSSPKIHNMPDEIKSPDKQNSNITEPKSHKLNEGGVLRKSFVSTVAENIVDNKLKLIPTGMNDGREVSIMWGKFGLIDIVTQNDMFLIKFRDEVGMNHVLENRPWMVNNKPMFIQKWDTSIIMDRKEPKALPLWVKLHSVPIEAWTVNGISAIASSLGKPLIMDKTTTKMCNEGRGRFSYARVLIEVQAEKEFKEKVEICYSSNQNPEGNFSKYVDVEYSWKPPVCTLCKVFGHFDRNCGKVHNGEKPNFGNQGKTGNGTVKEGFVDGMQNRYNDKRGQKNDGTKINQMNKNLRVRHRNGYGTRVEYRPIKKVSNDEINATTEDEGRSSTQQARTNVTSECISPKSAWKLNKNNMEELRRSANKYQVLEDYEETEISEEHRPNGKEIVDKFVNYQRQPSIKESKEWTREMFKYFKEQWEDKWDNGFMDVEDVHEEENGMSKDVSENVLNAAWNVRGMCNRETQKEVDFAFDENFGLLYDMIDFQECIEQIEIEDLKSCGIHFTWIKSRQNPESGILKKIDRVMGNNNFMGTFCNSTAHFLPHLSSDHCHAVLIMPKVLSRKKRAFKFTNYVADKPEFLEIVEKEWNIETSGCKMYKLVQKLKAMKFHMKNLNWKHGNLYEIVESWKVKLKNVQMQVDKDPHNVALKTEEARTLKEYMIAMQDEEKFLYQKAKITWMSDGDRNSRFFHEVIKGRIHKNRIDMVCNEKGERFEGKSVADQFVSHFLGKAMQVNPFVPNSLNLKKVSMEDAASMVKPVTNEEIKCALFDICDSKAPRPDGYTSKFYKKAWSIVGDDVCSAVKEFFLKGKMLGEINATLITLVPKLSTPMKVSDYRPITCCNVLYKIINKILTNRIKSALCKIVSPCQSAFIPGRQITDNILLTQELLRGYNWKNGPKRVAMKIDIQKAYDTVNRDFLEEVLKEFNFPKEMVHWVMGIKAG
ncbi:RNA-directed DNA polymerase, eukaryota, reverse transcriptase zinc-binding domain protein [Tanacetum coccineum]